ncbi:MAG TPA: hypothetical protein VFF06_25210 [Polyangia bacterium]|nr:hypothetical protein [Polyangia bacterium]
MRASFCFVLVMAAGCGDPSNRGKGNGHGDGGASQGDGGYVNNGPSFSTMCNGTPTTISGNVMAPNAVDPIANAFAYVPISTGSFPAGVSCDLCDQPVDGAGATATTGADGHFTLDISQLPPMAQVPFTVNKGRFRHTGMLPITACQDNNIGAPFTVLPGKSGPGDDIPKIAVTTGVKDQLDVVLAAMGLDQNVGFDCFENRTSTTSTLTSPCGKRLMAQGASAPTLTALLKDPNMLAQYNILFISCARGKFKTLSAADQMTVTTNLHDWAAKGGRVFATDNAYDYIAQSFPNDVTFLGGNTTIDAANVGVGSVTMPATYTGRINDTTMAAWLTAVSALPSGSNTLPLTGYLTQWSVVQSVPMSTADEVDATDAQVQPTGGTAMTGSYPQTIRFDVMSPTTNMACGRAIFSSYHTLEATMGVDATQLSPQERILEYLMFEAGACSGPIS